MVFKCFLSVFLLLKSESVVAYIYQWFAAGGSVELARSYGCRRLRPNGYKLQLVLNGSEMVFGRQLPFV